MWLRNHLINPVVRALGRSRAHPLLGIHLVLLGYIGRRTGRAYELPVMAAPAGADLVVVVGQHDAKTWWRNFSTTPQDVTVRSRGRVLHRSARRLAPGDPGYVEAVASYRRAFPRVAVEPAAPVLVLTDVRDALGRGTGAGRASRGPGTGAAGATSASGGGRVGALAAAARTRSGAAHDEAAAPEVVGTSTRPAACRRCRPQEAPVTVGEPRDEDGADVLPLCPFSLDVAPIARFMNFELSDDPVYDGLELQWFDDDVHGTGMLAFLSRRADRRVDYYPQRGLGLDAGGYEIGGGTRSWTATDFQIARLEVTDDGVDAEVRFTDVDGRLIDVRVDDRDGRRRRRAQLLAPVSAGIDRPKALLLVWLSGFDLVRATGPRPVIRVGGRQVATGRLPGARVHRRHLIKYAAPVCAVEVNRSHDGAVPAVRAGQRLELAADRSAIEAVLAEQGGHSARMVMEPALPDVRTLPDGSVQEGRWLVAVDSVRLTGGTWSAARSGDQVTLGLDVTERWRPGPLPWLMRVVTLAVPVFRRWPTTYRWRAVVRLGPPPTMTSGWERVRVTSDDAQGYRRWTRS